MLWIDACIHSVLNRTSLLLSAQKCHTNVPSQHSEHAQDAPNAADSPDTADTAKAPSSVERFACNGTAGVDDSAELVHEASVKLWKRGMRIERSARVWQTRSCGPIDSR